MQNYKNLETVEGISRKNNLIIFSVWMDTE